MTSEGLRDVNLSIKVPIISLISPSEGSGAESTSTAEMDGIAGAIGYEVLHIPLKEKTTAHTRKAARKARR